MSSKIEWTDETWNPVVGCTRVSSGCDHCYAVRHTKRLAGKLPIYQGLVNDGKNHFNGTVRTIPERLDQPLRWRKPRRVFVNSMSDLFHPGVPEDFLDRVFAVMALAPDHVFQVLTKRPERMAEYLAQAEGQVWDRMRELPRRRVNRVVMRNGSPVTWKPTWPLENVWCGTSCEDQETADERIPHLLRTPAAVRFLSCEPLLGPIDLAWPWLTLVNPHDGSDHTLDWIIVGGESGPGSRPMRIGWARSLVEQCREATVPVFVKQLGGVPYEERPAEGGPQGTDEALRNIGQRHPQERWFAGKGWCLTSTPDGRSRWMRPLRLDDRKGGDPSEWPEDLRVREWPLHRELGSQGEMRL